MRKIRFELTFPQFKESQAKQVGKHSLNAKYPFVTAFKLWKAWTRKMIKWCFPDFQCWIVDQKDATCKHDREQQIMWVTLNSCPLLSLLYLVGWAAVILLAQRAVKLAAQLADQSDRTGSSERLTSAGVYTAPCSLPANTRTGTEISLRDWLRPVWHQRLQHRRDLLQLWAGLWLQDEEDTTNGDRRGDRAWCGFFTSHEKRLF